MRDAAKFRPGLIAWILLIAYVVAADLTLIRHRKPTMSRTMGHYLRKSYGPLVAGVALGTAWHLVCSEPFQWDDETTT